MQGRFHQYYFVNVAVNSFLKESCVLFPVADVIRGFILFLF